MGTPTATLIVNPASGHGRAGKLLPQVTLALVRGLSEYTVQVRATKDYAEANQCAREAVLAASGDNPAHPDMLLVMGGDGMASVGLNACVGSNVRLGVIPAGTANDFCRGMGVPYTTIDAVKAVLAGYERLVDLTEVDGRLTGGEKRRYVGSVVSTGYDAKVNYRTNHRTVSLGSVSYTIDALAELARFKPLDYRVVIDGQALELPAMFIAVGNAGVFGGGMQVCPLADPTDGWLDITIARPISRLGLLRLLPQMYSGAFAKDPCVELLRCREITIDGGNMFAMGDGEELGEVPLTARCRQGALYLLGSTKPNPLALPPGVGAKLPGSA
ncbi:MAG: diacylglycerol kinase family lipid kinase [Propionibacteriaceae bacterium]|jgi:diacylglycerol kinase (ATP)|nr:diacylglycerol kinase family lipid kinase [Propionibacteriaceae bacterium]